MATMILDATMTYGGPMTTYGPTANGYDAEAIPPRTEEIIIGECECGTCGRTYDFERDGAEISDQCPGCQAAEEAAAAAEEAREEAIAEAEDELATAECDLEGLLEELRDVKERIAETRRTAAAARRKIQKLTA